MIDDDEKMKKIRIKILWKILWWEEVYRWPCDHVCDGLSTAQPGYFFTWPGSHFHEWIKKIRIIVGDKENIKLYCGKPFTIEGNLFSFTFIMLLNILVSSVFDLCVHDYKGRPLTIDVLTDNWLTWRALSWWAVLNILFLFHSPEKVFISVT